MNHGKITVVCPEQIGTIAPELYGHFVEHIGGVVYDGIWVGKDSDIPNECGFRKDLLDKLRAVKPAVIRWPVGLNGEKQNATATLLWNADFHAQNTFDSPETVTPTSFPIEPNKPVNLPRTAVMTIAFDIK